MFKRKKRTLLISALPFGWGGAGDHIKEICLEFKPDIILVPIKISPFKRVNKVFAIIQFFIIIIRAIFFIKIFNCELIFNHPQTLGYRFCGWLIRNSSKIHYNVVDTHFFCVKSYNFYSNAACLRCLYGEERYVDCFHFPRFQSESAYKFFQETILEKLDNIIFYCQTKTYKQFLQHKFGENASVNVKKMHTFELKQIAFPSVINKQSKHNASPEKYFDIGYHAAFLPAKGSTYILELSTKCPKIKFFVPSKKVGGFPNVFFTPCSWDDGLKVKLDACKIVICPSIWSAPVEGAVLKSMLSEKPVALLPSNTFVDELPSGSFIKLTGNIKDDSEILQWILKLENQKKLKEIGVGGKKFALNYLESVELEKIF